MGEKITGAILAGGTGRRFGGCIKPKIPIDGEPIISRILSIVRAIFHEIIIVTNDPEEFLGLAECRIIEDRIRDSGPLGGIHAALHAAEGRPVFVIAGDMPYLSKAIITMLIDEWEKNECDVVVPRIGELIEPLHAIYSQSCLDRLDSYLTDADSLAVRDFIRNLNIHYCDLLHKEETTRAFRNINLPSDL